jgi:cytochrome P450
MYGPINSLFLREAKEDNYLNQLAIKKGTIVTLQHMGNHYSTKYFKDPFTFRPERWEK